MAYAAVTTLVNTLDGLLSPNPYVVLEKNEYFDSFEQLRSLQAFLDGSAQYGDEKATKELEKRIAAVAYKAQDLVDLFLCGLQESHDNNHCTLLRVHQEIKSVQTNLEMIYSKTRDLSKHTSTSKDLSKHCLNLKSRGKIAHAAALCLLESLDLLSGSIDSMEYGRFESVRGKLASLETWLKESAKEIVEHDDMEVLEQKILKASRNLIYLVSCCQSKDSKGSTMCRFQLPVEEIEYIKIELKQIYDDVKAMGTGSGGVRISQGKGTCKQSTSSYVEDNLVGLDDDMIRIKEWLTGSPSKLDVIPIVGMGGTGKTTLTRRLFDDPFTRDHFYIRAWTTASQEYILRDLLSQLLSSVPGQSKSIYDMSDEQLVVRLYQDLKGRKYLVVLDDLWSTKTWDDLRRFFPDDQNGSRIILTSRLAAVAAYANSSRPHHQMHLLSEDDSWKLLRNKVLADQECDPDLVPIGKQIANACRGLPLAIVVVAGFLYNMRRTKDCWKDVAQSIGTIVARDPTQCNDILALSYHNMPHHLKACFLYMGAFGYDADIHVRRIIMLWVAEGFLRAEPTKSLENVAEECLCDLINRNMVIVKKRRFNGTVKVCGVHDLLMDLILREVRENNFLHIVQKGFQPSHDERRISYPPDITFDTLLTNSKLVRSFLSFKYLGTSSSPQIFSILKELKLLRVLELRKDSSHFPTALVDLVQLRYLAFGCSERLPVGVCKLWNLQILINDGEDVYILPEVLHKEIWLMQNLRHLIFLEGLNIPPPPRERIDGSNSWMLPNLLTLKYIDYFSCTREVLAGAPNLKRLGIELHEDESGKLPTPLDHLVHLCALESLKFACFIAESNVLPLPQWVFFPPNLKQLSLFGSQLSWEDMKTIAMLPKLEVLKLDMDACVGRMWKPICGGFCQLKFLQLGSLHLEYWKASSNCFPNLHSLLLRRCPYLKKIPRGIGRIPTLQSIEVHDCRPSANTSAKRIQEEQESEGNDSLDVRIYREYKLWEKKVDEESGEEESDGEESGEEESEGEEESGEKESDGEESGEEESDGEESGEEESDGEEESGEEESDGEESGEEESDGEEYGEEESDGEESGDETGN